MMSAYGVLPLQDFGLNENESTPETILALVLHAMLTSARISHELAYKSLKCLIEAGYHNLDTPKKSTWEARAEVLTKGWLYKISREDGHCLGKFGRFRRK